MGGDTNRDSYRFVIGGLTLWAHFAGGASFQALSPVLPLISEEYGIGHATAGLLVGVVLIIMGAFGLPGGIIAGRLGLRKTYTAAWLLMSLMTLVALSPGFGGLLALRVAFGLGMAAMLPATAPLLMQWFRPKEPAHHNQFEPGGHVGRNGLLGLRVGAHGRCHRLAESPGTLRQHYAGRSLRLDRLGTDT